MQVSKVVNALQPEELLNYFQSNSLFSHEEMESKVLPLLAGKPLESTAQFARLLEQAGLLTEFQAEAIRAGKLEELRIGNYDVLDRLGSGGMGTVFKARHRRMKRVVALKVMSRQLCSDEKAVQRFQREVETIARLQHPNIVMAYDADEAEVGHFLVMEFVSGKDLSSTVQQFGPLSVAAAVQCILQSAQGLEYAHREGIVHRDIKPANLLLDEEGVVKVTDLGLARIHEQNAPGQSSLTQAGGIVGTADYMSPEQAFDSLSLDHRTDIYSLGCTVYFLLTGQPPYVGTSIMATLLKHLEGPIPTLSAHRNDIDPAINALFQKMVAKKATDRFQTMTEVVAALKETSALHNAEQALSQFRARGHHQVVIQDRLASADSNPSSQTMDLVPATREAAAPKTSVLLVEPSRTQAAIIRKYLEGLDIEVFNPVHNAREALEIARRAAPAVVVSAMHLKEMSGVQLAEAIAEINSSSAFVLISSEDEVQNAGSMSHLRNTLILHKPFTAEQLVQTLNAITGKQLHLSASLTRGSDDNLPTSLFSPKLSQTRDRSLIRVLMVDDSATARICGKMMLQQLGFSNLTEATDGAQAVAALARESFDLILCDYNMPLMDGPSLLTYVRSNPATKSVPFIMVTTETDPNKLQAIREMGVAGVCDKSFNIEALRSIADALFS